MFLPVCHFVLFANTHTQHTESYTRNLLCESLYFYLFVFIFFVRFALSGFHLLSDCKLSLVSPSFATRSFWQIVCVSYFAFRVYIRRPRFFVCRHIAEHIAITSLEPVCRWEGGEVRSGPTQITFFRSRRSFGVIRTCSWLKFT